MISIDVEAIERLVIGPDDLLLVTIPNGVPADQADAIAKAFLAKLPEGIRVLVKPESLHVQVVTCRDMTS